LGQRKISLQTLLVAVPALAILPLIAFSLWLLQLVWQNGRDEARRDLEQMAGTLAIALESEIAASVRELERIAEFPTLAPERFAEFHDYARRLLERNESWANLVLLEPDGKVLLNAALPFDRLPSIVVSQPHVLAAARTVRPVVSDVFTSPLTQENAIGVAVPVVREGVVRWVLNARLSPDALSRFVGQRLYREGAIAAVSDNNYRIVTRSRLAAKFFGGPVTPDLRKALEASPARGVATLYTLDGARVLTAWERLPWGWSLMIGVPIHLYDAPRERSFLILIGFGLLVLAAGVALSLALGRRISSAIDAVAADARSLAAGAPVAPRTSPIRQVATLFASLREASRVQRDKELARDQAVAALREADRRKDEFLAMLAHELRNPLAPLRNAIGVLSRMLPAEGAARQALGMGDRQVRQLTRLVDDLLDVSRITQGKIELQRRPVSVIDAVVAAAETLRPSTDPRGQSLTLDLPETSPVVSADPARLAQVLENLLSNASKYTDPGGSIRVQVDDDDAHEVVIRVCDTGIGLPPEQLERVFEMFTQLDGSRERAQGGLGIGLSLVRRLVELHGGTVSARSDGPGRGACFVVRLPRVDEAVPA
jgi:signal transduction histidine kinase